MGLGTHTPIGKAASAVAVAGVSKRPRGTRQQRSTQQAQVRRIHVGVAQAGGAAPLRMANAQDVETCMAAMWVGVLLKRRGNHPAVAAPTPAAANGGTDGEPSPPPCSVRLDAVEAYLVDFLSAAGAGIAAGLRRHNVVGHIDSCTTTYSLRRCDTGDALAAQEIADLYDACGSSVADIREVDWKAVAQALVDETMAIVRELLASVGAPLPDAPDVTVALSVPYGDPSMVPFDVAFQTLAWKHVICIPDMHAFTDAHFAFMAERYRGAGHLAQHWLMRVLGAMCHETIHVVQGITKQVDKTKDNWSSEHDASVPSFALLREVLRRWRERIGGAVAADAAPAAQLQVLAVPGLFETVVAYFCEELSANIDERWRDDDMAQYHTLRDSFGLAPIDVATSADRVTVQSDMKCLLALDCDTGACMARLARVLLKIFAPARRGVSVVDAPRPSWVVDGEEHLGVPGAGFHARYLERGGAFGIAAKE